MLQSCSALGMIRAPGKELAPQWCSLAEKPMQMQICKVSPFWLCAAGLIAHSLMVLLLKSGCLEL